MTLSKSKLETNYSKTINFLFCFLPISFILGNLAINLNIVLFCLLGIIHLKSKILTSKYNISIKFIFLLFVIVFISSSLSFMESIISNGYENKEFILLIKSIMFFRFFLLLAITYLLSELEVLNFEYFFLSVAFFPIFISLDIIFQYIFGFNIVGLKKPIGSIQDPILHNTGFFGEELIAGGFIQNFSFFSIFLITFFLIKKNYYRFILTTILISILGVAILLTANKMPLLLFLFGLFLIFLFDKKLRIIVFTSFICIFLIFNFIFSKDERLKNWQLSGYWNVKSMVVSLLGKATYVEPDEIDSSAGETKQEFHSSHKKIYLTAIDAWKQNKILGNGIKSFRTDCHNFAPSKYRMCSNHPHNYYFEILTETGIVGISIVLIIASLLGIFIYKNLKFLKRDNINTYIFLSAVVSLALGMFPFKSTGSIFSTSNIGYIMLITSIVLSYRKQH
tara:strand:+ start:1572 stop:2921 length:1350 start_codon:yes stop_codon:yes gene_type:complete